jgi:hypothetical protein
MKPIPIKVEVVRDLRLLPKASIQYSASDPAEIIESFKRKYKRNPDKILHYVSPIGNWQFYSIPMEEQSGE